MTTPFDAGLQPERTELAWRRTALALALGSLIAVRLFPAALNDVAWITPGVLGLVAAAIIALIARRRYRAIHRLLHTRGDRAAMPGAVPLAALAAISIAAGAVGLVIVVLVER